jgi:hypothetical protein
MDAPASGAEEAAGCGASLWWLLACVCVALAMVCYLYQLDASRLPFCAAPGDADCVPCPAHATCSGFEATCAEDFAMIGEGVCSHR